MEDCSKMVWEHLFTADGEYSIEIILKRKTNTTSSNDHTTTSNDHTNTDTTDYDYSRCMMTD